MALEEICPRMAFSKCTLARSVQWGNALGYVSATVAGHKQSVDLELYT